MADEVQEQAFKDLMAELEAKRWTPLMNSDDVSSLFFNVNALEGEGFPFLLREQSCTFRPSFYSFSYCPSVPPFAHLPTVSLSAHVFSFR
jgi:hypothetical protein